MNISYASRDYFTLQIMNLALGLSKVEFDKNMGYYLFENSIDESLKNTIDSLRPKADNTRKIITLKKSDIKPIIDYVFDSSVKGDKNVIKKYIQSNGTNAEKFVAVDTDKKIIKTGMGDLYLYSTNDNIYFDEVRSDFFISDDSFSLNYTNYDDVNFLEFNTNKIEKKSDSTYLSLSSGRSYKITNTDESFDNIHNAYSDNYTVISQIQGNKPITNDIVGVYSVDDYKNAVIFEPPKVSYKNLENAIDTVFTDDNTEIEFRLMNTVAENTAPSYFFNDNAEGEKYEKALFARASNNNNSGNSGGVLNLDWLKNLIDTIIDTTKNIYNTITGIPTKLGQIYDSISSMFDVTQFQLDLTPLKVNFMERFPFCIPMDFLKGIKTFNISMSKPEFKINIDTQYIKINETLNLGMLDYVRGFFRYVAVAWYSIFLIMRTRDMIKW